MFIDAFTSCVGPVYASYLKRSLPVWMDTLDSLTVITMPDDKDTIEACKPYSRLRLLTTDVFKQYGAAFNKGAALTMAYAAMEPLEGALHFDSDIEPSPNWRKAAEREFEFGGIHGALRYGEDGKLIRDDGPWPYGYFQLWHADDPAVQFWPIFEPWHPHAGSYDLEFLEKWQRTRWRKLSFPVTHYGEVRKNWFGVGLPEEQQKESFQKMANVHRVGLAKTRVLSRQKSNRLNVPNFKLKFALPATQPELARKMVRACMTDNPFLVSCVVGNAMPSYERISPRVTVEQIRARVEEAYSS